KRAAPCASSTIASGAVARCRSRWPNRSRSAELQRQRQVVAPDGGLRKDFFRAGGVCCGVYERRAEVREQQTLDLGSSSELGCLAEGHMLAFHGARLIVVIAVGALADKQVGAAGELTQRRSGPRIGHQTRR